MSTPEVMLAVVDDADPAGAEAEALARRMAATYARTLAYFRREMRIPPAEADVHAQAAYAADAGAVARLADTPAPEVSWATLATLQECDPVALLTVWARVKAAAAADLATGQRAADVLEGTPWERAQFLVLRAALIDEWQPRGGVEQMLIDTLAHAQTAWLFWLGQLHEEATTQGRARTKAHGDDGFWRPPTVGLAEAMDQSAAMADRFNRLMLRTLRALRDLRRYSAPVIVQHAGQVNVGAQQVNVGQAAVLADRPTGADDA